MFIPVCHWVEIEENCERFAASTKRKSLSLYYHASFTERFLGLPQENPDAYRETAAMMYVKNLKGNLLLMHGTGDDNVHYQNTEVLINELIEAKKRFSVMIYPNRSHGLSEGKNTQYHRYDIYTWYLIKNMSSDQR